MENKTDSQFKASQQENNSAANQPAGQKGITVAKVLSDANDFIKKAGEARAQKRNSTSIDFGGCDPDGNEVKVKSFPVDAFPEVIQQIIIETNRCLNFPIDFIGASLLCTAGIAVGNTHKVQVKKTWYENPVMYLALVGKSGTTKSHPLSFALEPIYSHDRKSYKDYLEQKSEYDYINSLSKKEKEETGIGEVEKPVLKKNLVSDITPESLAEVHKFNIRGIGLHADELASWVRNFDRYNNGSEEQFWLSTWSGKTITIDRKSSEPILIASPAISVVGTIQTGILKELSGNDKSQNGFIDRILFAYPGHFEKEYWSEEEVNELTIENWHKIISRILELPVPLDEAGNPRPEILSLNPEAKKLYVEWYNQNIDLSKTTEDEAKAGLFAKLSQYTLRFSLILELLYWSCGESERTAVGVKAISGAIELAEYFRSTALKVHEILSNPLEQLPENKQKLYAALPETFTTAEGHQLAESFKISERTYKRFLKDKKFFRWLKQGNYLKLI